MTEAPPPEKLRAFEKQKKRLLPLVVAGVVYVVSAVAASIYFGLNQNAAKVLIFGPIVLVGYLFRLKCPYCSQAIWGTRFEACPKCGGILTSKPRAAAETPKPLEPFLLRRKTAELRQQFLKGKKYARYGFVCMILIAVLVLAGPFLGRPELRKALGIDFRIANFAIVLALVIIGAFGFVIAGAVQLGRVFKCPACGKVFLQSKQYKRELKTTQFCPHCRADLREYIRQVFGS